MKVKATSSKRWFPVLALVMIFMVVNVGADQATRFGMHTTTATPERVLKWQDWTGDSVTAVGENLFATSWEDFTGRNPESGIGFTLAKWETFFLRNSGKADQKKILMEFALPIFPDRPGPGAPDYIELQSRWEEGASGEFNDHFRKLAETLVEKGWGKAYLRPGWEFNIDSEWNRWGIRDQPKHWPHFVAYWRQIHEAMMSVEGAEFKWVWSTILEGDQAGFDAVASVWPGSNYVDVVGVDVYDGSGNYYWQQYEADEPTNDWFTLRRWNWEEIAYGTVRDPYTGEVHPDTVPCLTSMYDFAQREGVKFAISEWGVLRGDSFPKNDTWGGNDNPLFVEAMARWISEREVEYALYFENFLISQEYGNVDHSILPDYWNQIGVNGACIHSERVGNPLSSLQYLECFHGKLPGGWVGEPYDAPLLSLETFEDDISHHWELSGDWKVYRDSLSVDNTESDGKAVAMMKTPSIGSQSLLFNLAIAEQGEGVHLEVGRWKIGLSLFSDGRLGSVTLVDVDNAKVVETNLIGKPYVIGETFVPVKVDLGKEGVTVFVGDVRVLSHEVEPDEEMSMDVKIVAGSKARVFLKSLEIRGGVAMSAAQ